MRRGGSIDGLEFDYARPGEKPDCRWREKAERERMLTRVAQDAERALQAVEQADGLLDDEAIGDAHRLLRELIGQDFDIDDDGVPRLHRGTRVGPDHLDGRPGDASRPQELSSSALTATSSRRRRPTRAEPLITAVDVAPAQRAGRAAGQAPRSTPSPRRAARERVLGDTAYGNGPVRAELAERDVEVLAPGAGGQDQAEAGFAKRDFQIDLDAGTVTCPAGQHGADPHRTDRASRRELHQAHVCETARCATRCVRPARGRGRSSSPNDEDLLIAARQALATPTPAEHLRRTRPRIERLLGLLAVRYGAQAAARRSAASTVGATLSSPVVRVSSSSRATGGRSRGEHERRAVLRAEPTSARSSSRSAEESTNVTSDMSSTTRGRPGGQRRLEPLAHGRRGGEVELALEREHDDAVGRRACVDRVHARRPDAAGVHARLFASCARPCRVRGIVWARRAAPRPPPAVCVSMRTRPGGREPGTRAR